MYLCSETGFHTASLKKISDEIKKNQVLLEKLLEQHCDTIIIPTSGVDSSKFKALRKEWVQVVIRILDQFDNLSKQMAALEKLIEFTGDVSSPL